MKPRAAWPVLVKKAQDRVDRAQAEVVKARERLKSLQASRQRMQALYDDYVRRCREAEQTAQSITVSQSFRAFIQQVQGLILRVDADLTLAEQHWQQCRQHLQHAENKRLQMQTLMDKDLQRVRAHVKQREQKAMDATGVMLFNLRNP